jgi:hypothetical protein
MGWPEVKGRFKVGLGYVKKYLRYLDWFIVAVGVLEYIKYRNYRQPRRASLLKFWIFGSILTVLPRLKGLTPTVVLAFDIIETVSYRTTNAGITMQVLGSIDLNWIFIVHWRLGIMIVSAFIGLWIIARLVMRYEPSDHLIRSSTNLFIGGACCIFLPAYVKHMKHNMLPFDGPDVSFGGIGSELTQALRRYHNTTIVSHFRPSYPRKKRNLIILEMESLEQGWVGRWNPRDHSSMPFVSRKVTRQGLLVKGIKKSAHTVWSVASTFAVHCGMPLLPHRSLRRRDLFHLAQQHICIGDFLRPLGFRLESYLTRTFCCYFREGLEMHNWKVYDESVHGIWKDWDMVDHLVANVIPALKNSTEPFILHWGNTDTHPWPFFFVDERCQNRMPNATDVIRSFDCLDQNIERLFDGIEKSGILETTDIFFYGDHPVMLPCPELKRLRRRLFFAIPTLPRRKIRKNVTIWDYGPTILDLLGVDYKPKFLFGHSIFAREQSRLLTRYDEMDIYEYFSRLTWEKKFVDDWANRKLEEGVRVHNDFEKWDKQVKKVLEKNPFAFAKDT